MLWRHLFQQFIASPQFVNPQLAFEKEIYQRMMRCYKNQSNDSKSKLRCAKENESRLQKYSVAVQWLIREREKSLEEDMRSCRSQKSQKLLECADKKSLAFVTKNIQKDKKYLYLLREQLKSYPQ